MNAASKRAPTLSVAQPRMKPTMAVSFSADRCQVRSLNLPDVMPMMMATTALRRYGGALMTRVMVVL